MVRFPNSSTNIDYVSLQFGNYRILCFFYLFVNMIKKMLMDVSVTLFKDFKCIFNILKIEILNFFNKQFFNLKSMKSTLNALKLKRY